MNCEMAQRLLSDYDLGLLEGRQRAELEAHLETCAACGEQLARWRNLDSLVLGEQVEASEALVRTVMHGVRALQGSRVPLWLRVLDLGAAPAVVAVLVGGLLLAVWSRLPALTAAVPGGSALAHTGVVTAFALVAAVAAVAFGWYVNRLATEVE
jgi:anti-sigma factor RsiW